MADAPLGVLLGADSLLTRRSGIGRVTLEIASALRGRPEIGRLRLLIEGRLHEPGEVIARLAGAPQAEPPSRPAAPGRAAGLLRRAKARLGGVPAVHRLHLLKHSAAFALGQRAEMRRLIEAGRGGVVYHEPNMIPQPMIPPAWNGATVIAVNDLSWHHHKEFHPADRIAWIERNLPRAIDRARRFVTISEFTAAALAAEFGVKRSRIDVVPLAAGEAFRPVGAEAAAAALARHGLGDRGYVLSVSTLEPRKNFDRLVAAHLALPAALRARFPLVIAGGSGWGAALASGDAERARRDGTLRLLGHVPDEDLAVIYARAALFAYVSIYEGFGLPVVEAMQADTAVVASATTATGETAGDAALLVDPLDVSAIAGAMRRLLEDAALAAHLRAAGRARAALFSWDRTATCLIGSWRRALA